MKHLFFVILMASIVSLLLPADGLCQGPSPCNNYCDACASDCIGQTDPCSPDCLNCILEECMGSDIPVSDHVGYLLIGGFIMSTFYFIRRRRIVAN